MNFINKLSDNVFASLHTVLSTRHVSNKFGAYSCVIEYRKDQSWSENKNVKVVSH